MGSISATRNSVDGHLHGELTEQERADLESLLGDEQACRWYRDFCLLQAELRFLVRAGRSCTTACEGIRPEEAENEISSITGQPFASADPLPMAPSSQIPILDFLTPTLHHTVGWFSSGWPVAYLIATVIFGVGLLIGSVMPCPSRSRSPGNRQCPAGWPRAEDRSLSAGLRAWSIASGRVQGSGFRVQDSPRPPGEGQGVRAAVTAFILHPSSLILRLSSLLAIRSPWLPA